MNSLRIIIAVILAFPLLQVWGQDVGENTLIITSGFTPQIKDARKLNQKPNFSDTIYAPPKFNYSIINTKVATSFSVRPIRAAKMSGEKLDKVYNSYVLAGMGNKATPMFEFLYSMGRSRDQRGGIQLKHLSSAGKIDNYIYPGFSDNLVRGYYDKMWKKTRFETNVSYTRTMRHYYGVNLEDPILIAGNDLSDEANMHLYNQADVNFRFSKYKVRGNEMNYDFGLAYHYILDNYATRENGVIYDGVMDWGVDFVKSLKEQRIGVNTKVNFYNNSDSLYINNSFIIGVAPFYRLKFKKLDAEIGIVADVTKDSISEIGFYPDVKLRLDVIDDVLNFVFRLYGGAHKNNLWDISKENPFVNSILPMEISVNKVSTSISMQSSISRFINLELGMNYEKWENAPFYITDTTVALQNKFTFVYDAYDMVSLHFGASYHLNQKWNILGEVNYYVYNTQNELFAWHKPDYNLKLSANYNLGDKISVHANLIYTGPSKAPLYENNVVKSQEVSPWLDGSLGIEYRYHKRLGIFVNFNNIAASNYNRWYNYPSYGFNVIGGLSYIF